MADNPIIQRYLDAGMAFTQMTQARAEAIVKDLVKAGELQTEQAQTFVADILDRSRKNTERLLEQIRDEVRDQIASLGLATRDDISRLEAQIAALTAQQVAAAKQASADKVRVEKPAAEKAGAKKAAGKATAKKAAQS